MPKEKITNNYKIDFNYLLKINEKYLKEILSKKDLRKLEKNISKHKNRGNNFNNQDIVKLFSNEYLKIIKSNYRKNERTKEYNYKTHRFINTKKNKIKLVWGNCLNALKQMEAESIQLMITSPPYYNAREYSQWDNISLYLEEMNEIIKETYRVLDNHRIWVFNVGDIFDNDRLTTKSVWGKRRIPLGAYFIKIFKDAGFEFVDDIIWDKGEVESKRHMNNGISYPFYQYPLNCYEHILIFHKHRRDKIKIPCPICGSLNVNSNSQSEIGVQSWECKNNRCFVRSPHNRGKRFSLRTNLMQYYHNNNDKNIIDSQIIKKWRRDIVKFPPVIKITHDKKNRIGHTAPFPEAIPEMAIKYFSFINENILDPFAGSFTVPIVAKKLSRNGIGMELNKSLFKNAIVKRINSNFKYSTNNYIEYDI